MIKSKVITANVKFHYKYYVPIVKIWNIEKLLKFLGNIFLGKQSIACNNIPKRLEIHQQYLKIQGRIYSLILLQPYSNSVLGTLPMWKQNLLF